VNNIYKEDQAAFALRATAAGVKVSLSKLFTEQIATLATAVGELETGFSPTLTNPN
jgi:hypothetical protein